jgi:hypothetical protein
MNTDLLKVILSIIKNKIGRDNKYILSIWERLEIPF